MKQLFSLILILLLATTAFARKPLQKRKHNVNRVLKTMIADPYFKTAGFGFLAVDVNSGEVISEYNPDMALRPASNLKLISTATALERLSPGFRFMTLLQYSGAIDTVQHLLRGNVIIKGGGDPSLGSKYFQDTKSKQFLAHWVKAIQHLGIDTITGAVIADAGFFSRDMIPGSWSWQNLGNYFGAGACGLTIFDNSYTACFNTGNRVGDPVKLTGISPAIPGLDFSVGATADTIDYDNSNIYGVPYCNQRFISGTLPVGKSRFCVKGSMPDPALVAASQLDSALSSNNIRRGMPATTIRILKNSGRESSYKTETFDTLLSPKLAVIIAQTNTKSINLFAEHCAFAAGLALGAVPETVVAMDSIKSFWKQRGMDTEGMRLTDGSGLSQYDVITPKQLVFLLSYMQNRSWWFDDFYNSLAVGGQTGTLEDMFHGTCAEGNIRAKSGTIDGAKSYSGYVVTKSGREVAFSMIVNNFSCSSKEAKSKLEKLMVALAEFEK